MTVAIVGLGYVGLSLACLLSKDNNVISVDIDQRKVGLIERGISPIADAKIETYLKSEAAKLHVTSDAPAAYEIADYVVIATPTDYDEGAHRFDTSSPSSCEKGTPWRTTSTHHASSWALPRKRIAPLQIVLRTFCLSLPKPKQLPSWLWAHRRPRPLSSLQTPTLLSGSRSSTSWTPMLNPAP